ncbi:MAG: dUTP diphosphatase [Deltaproteobacteria bacterium]|nr:dUTP diphosphatase [Deltaproteobacteria bacterium]
MNENTIAILPLHPRFDELALGPRRMSEHAAGYDIAAALDEPVTLAPGDRALIPCGFAMALPPDYEAQVRPRSGLAIKHGITLLNSPGTIDADYRGEVRVIVINHGSEPFVISGGERVAQIVIAKVNTLNVKTVNKLPESIRGGDGFGSTGR